MKRRRNTWRRAATLLVCSLTLLQVGACAPTALWDSIRVELVRSASGFVFVSTQTIAQNLLGV